MFLFRVLDESSEPCHVDEVFEALISCDASDLRFEVPVPVKAAYFLLVPV
jgi:hypothetical protein